MEATLIGDEPLPEARCRWVDWSVPAYVSPYSSQFTDPSPQSRLSLLVQHQKPNPAIGLIAPLSRGSRQVQSANWVKYNSGFYWSK
jgi:hypothetical protein